MGHMPRDRGHADEGSATGRPPGRRHGVLDAQHGPEHVQVEHSQELLAGEGTWYGTHAAAAAGVGDAAVQPPGRLQREFHGCGDVALDRYVRSEEAYAAPVGRDFGDAPGRLLELLRGASADRHRRPVGRELRRAGPADARRPTGHEDGEAFQAARGSCGRLHVSS